MGSIIEKLVSSEFLEDKLRFEGFEQSVDEGYLMLAELMLKTSAGFNISYTESDFLKSMCVMKKDGTPNKCGSKFLCEMFYASSNRRPLSFELMQIYRKE